MSHTVFTRNNDGLVQWTGTPSFHVPRSHTALGIIGTNSSVLGDPRIADAHFAEDYWIYDRDGKPFRKWFENRDYLRSSRGKTVGIWPPNLERIQWLEELRHKIYLIKTVHFDRIDAVIKKIYQKGGKAHSFPNYKYERESAYESRLYLWEIEPLEEFDSRLSYGWNWVSPVYAHQLINSDLGQELHRLDRRTSDLGSWSFKISGALNEAILCKLKQLYPEPKLFQQYRMEINGRDYWYETYQLRYGGIPGFKKLSWPDQETIVSKL